MLEGTVEVQFNTTLTDIRLTLAYFEAQSLAETIIKPGRRKSFCVIHSDTVLCDCDPLDPTSEGFLDFAYAPGFLGAWQAEVNSHNPSLITFADSTLCEVL